MITDRRGELVILPVWVAAYRYHDQVYRFLVNGSTGQSTGKAPISALKIGLMGLLIAIGVCFLLTALLIQRR